MNKKNIVKIFIFIWLFFTFIWNIFAFDANLQLDKKETDINDYIELKVEIHSDKWWNIWITDITWIDNFKIISQSQSQSSSTNIVVVNWKTESKIKTSYNFILTLKAKKKWDFILWPATLKRDNDIITTNSVKIKVSWDNLFINNNHLKVNTNTNLWWNNVNNLNANNLNNKQKDIEKYDNIVKKDFSNKNEIILIILVLIIFWWWFYFLLKNNYIITNNKDFNKKNKEENNQNNKENKKENNKEEEVDFENKNVEIIYPEVNDIDFINKLEQVFKQKLYKKYKIKNIDNKTFDEILSELNDKDENIEKIILLLNKVKYSKIIWDNNKLLNLVKNL